MLRQLKRGEETPKLLSGLEVSSSERREGRVPDQNEWQFKCSSLLSIMT